jgi:hypothetical protein
VPALAALEGCPGFAKPSIDDDRKGEIAALDTDFDQGSCLLSLTGFVGRYLISRPRSKHITAISLNRPFWLPLNIRQ